MAFCCPTVFNRKSPQVAASPYGSLPVVRPQADASFFSHHREHRTCENLRSLMRSEDFPMHQLAEARENLRLIVVSSLSSDNPYLRPIGFNRKSPQVAASPYGGLPIVRPQADASFFSHHREHRTCENLRSLMRSEDFPMHQLAEARENLRFIVVSSLSSDSPYLRPIGFNRKLPRVAASPYGNLPAVRPQAYASLLLACRHRNSIMAKAILTINSH